MLTFLDANVIIYVVEEVPPWAAVAAARIAALSAAGSRFALSHLVRMEVRVGPVSRGDVEVLGLYDAFVAAEAVSMVDITAGVCERATQIRAQHGFRAMDALHLAAALEAGCDVFLTNDTRLQAFADLTVEVLGSISAGQAGR